MSYPTEYDRAYDFQAYQNANPTRPLPGNQVNAELNAVQASIAEFGDFLAGITRADGALANGIVSADQLDTVLAAALGDIEAIATVEALVAAAAASAASAASSESVVVDSVAAAAASESAAAASASTASTQAGIATAQAVLADADRVQTNADAVATAADRVQTGLDRIATAADVVSTTADAISTAADAVSTAADAAATAADVISAAASASAAAASFDSFDDIYLGSKASDPTLDNDGNALVDGALYKNTTTGLKVYDLGTTSWGAYSAAAGILSLVEDTTPQLGGDLDLNGHTITGLVIGTNVQAQDATLQSIAALGTAADKMLYTTAADTWAELTVTSVGRALLDDTTTAAQLATLTARGQGRETISVPAGAMHPRTSNPCASLATTETTTNKINYRTLDFDGTSAEVAQFLVPMPKSWDEGQIIYQVLWTAASSSGGVVWLMDAIALSDDDGLDSTAFGPNASITDTLIATGDLHISPESSAFTVAGTPAAGDLVLFQISRNPASGSDTLAADARLIAVRIFYNTNAATDA